MLGFVGPTINVATNVSKVLGRLQSLRGLSEECEVLSLTLESIDAAFQLACCYQKRHRWLPLFNGAVRLTQGAIEACERVLDCDEDEALSAGFLREHMSTWLGRQKEGIKRQDQLPKLTAHLGTCMSSLQLAFSAMSTLQPPMLSTPQGFRQPFVLEVGAVEQARAAVQELEMGRRRRLLCCVGRLYTCSSSSVEWRSGEKEWNAGDVYVLRAELRADGAYHFVLQRVPQAAGDDERGPEGQDCESISFPLASLRLSRHWLGDVQGLEPHGLGALLAADQPAYLLTRRAAEGAAAEISYALPFEVAPRLRASGTSEDEEEAFAQRPLSAEAFEALASMLLLKGGLEDGKHCLAHVCDLDSPEGLERFLQSLRELVGPYEPSGAAAEEALLSRRLGRATVGP